MAQTAHILTPSQATILAANPPAVPPIVPAHQLLHEGSSSNATALVSATHVPITETVEVPDINHHQQPPMPPQAPLFGSFMGLQQVGPAEE
ncbi:hypothetical protein FRC08_002770 [Ceratobasidium sp. 394]|nr:hypothetical protein FRC08_002770 [Ceratobasidium sp. 394]